MNLLAAISVSIIAAAALGALARRVRQPLILGYIAAGAVLGPHLGLGIIADEASIELISDIGLVLLLFLIGLEISLPRLAQAGRAITVSGLLQVPICAGLAWLVFGPFAAVTGGRFDQLYLAVTLSFSSTLIVVKLLSDKFELSTFGGRVTLGILVFQDVWAIAFLALQPNLQQLQPLVLLRSLGIGAALVIAALLCARFVLPHFFRAIATAPELMLVSSMAWCFLVSGAAAWAGLSAAMGALIAGVVIEDLPYSTEVISRISSVRDFFVTLFFVSLGLKIPEPSGRIVLFALAAVAFVIASRFVFMYPIFAVLRLDTRTAGVVAINLGQISEFSLVIMGLGETYGHVSVSATSLVLYTLLLTALLSTYGILYNHEVASRLSDALARIGVPGWLRASAPPPAEAPDPARTERDVFLLGVSREGLALLRHLERNAPAILRRIVAIDFNPETLERLSAYGVEYHYGDISNVESLRHAGIERAAVVVSGISDWFLKGTDNLRLLHHVRSLAPSARVVVTADTVEGVKRLYAEGADYVLMPPGLVAEHLHLLLSDRSPHALARARRRQQIELFGRKTGGTSSDAGGGASG